MAKEYAKGFYTSGVWRRCRAGYIASRVAIDGGMCEHCREVPGYIVDHIIEISPSNITDPEITLNHDNLQYLCLPCSNTKTFVKGARYRLTGDGEVVRICNRVNIRDVEK
jgi:5-methylcytosine-specific restriction protein A